jgi:drug/metabolite transporter (DMT)-like permease
MFGDSLAPDHGQALSTLGMLPVMATLALSGAGRRGAESGGGDRRRGVVLALLGGAVSCVGNIPYFNVLSRGAKASTVVPITALYPLVTILLAVPLLRERLNRIQQAGIGCSLLAIYLFNVQDDAGLFSGWLPVILLSVVLWGLAGFLQKLSTNHLSGASSALWFLSAFVPVGLLIVVRRPLPEGIDARTWILALGLGLTLALGNCAVLVAYAKEGKASIITPLVGLYPLVSIPIAILLLGERLSGRETLGILLALGSIGMLSWESEPAGPVSDADALGSLSGGG